jgi:hypothetical protein
MVWLLLPAYVDFISTIDQWRQDTLKAIATRAREIRSAQRYTVCTPAKLHAYDWV